MQCGWGKGADSADHIDLPLKGEAMPADERRTGFTVMLEAALQLAVEADA